MNVNSQTYHSFTILLVCCAIMWGVQIVSAQTVDQRLKITAGTNITSLNNFKSTLKYEYEANTVLLHKLAEKNNWKLTDTLANGQKVALQEIGDDGSPLYYETFADEAGLVSRATTLNTNGLLGLNLDGENLEVGVWDSGIALSDHVEYTSRMHVGDEGAEVDKHATLVTGSIISTGIKREAKGVANKAKVISHDWSRDKIEVAEAAANGMLLSNHSYGIMADRVPDWYFGAYTKVAQDWDKIMFNAPYYLMVSAAGNAQKSNDNASPLFGRDNDGYDVLLGFTLAKNGITVAGANSEIDKHGNLKKASVSAYSSFGPVDDGRIKPDLAGNGSSILSTDSYSTTSYNLSSGTSMATPGVTGSLLLLQQYHEELYGSYMRAATLKGLALHTADDVDAPGPDYRMGWGVMNAKKAAELLFNKDYNSYITEETLANNTVFSMEIQAMEGETLSASISWTDMASTFVNKGELNNTMKALVNDLDIKITKDGKTFLPWKLNPGEASSNATNGDNAVDPFERIDIPNARGNYTITITHKGKLQNEFQEFSLILSGVQMNACSVEAPQEIEIDTVDEARLNLTWEQNNDALYEVQYRETNQQEWITEYVNENSFAWEGLNLEHTYTLRIRSFCSQNVASEFGYAMTFTFKGAETVLESFNTLNIAPELSFNVFPNPAFNAIQLNLNTTDTTMYRIVSTSGVELKMGKVPNSRIDVSDLPPGLYVLQVQDFGLKKSAKFYKY
ncbi:Por secretion system C-terminal sorting domain-containing protein [Maribacter sedimenticola]|uniref:Por secretion system C-terminal sorting domain-containing protein n=1 Tax=Maribacter sedimenticola TaxID=228956 RepID=A0ABY1SC88_9FLAO|nr:S8 family serine peptidase [Maribacter sedimenticola]SNR25561.1 Por secretion system C-terminal sorting domain-containing protein [Maribacter sedimenticola]